MKKVGLIIPKEKSNVRSNKKNFKPCKKNKIIAGIHNATPEYALKMIKLGFQFVTISTDQRYMSTGAKSAVSKIKEIKTKEDPKAY